MNEAQSDLERWHIKALFRRSLILTLVLATAFAIPLYRACQGQNDRSLFWSALASGSFAIYFLMLLILGFSSMPGRRRYLFELLKTEYQGEYPPAAYEYRSRLRLFGLPLLHVRIGDRFDVIRGPVKAWIAIGSSYAVGVIFASGGLAIAPLSFGGIAIGLLPFGAVAIGALVIGCCGLGVWSTGALAFGWQAYGGNAIAGNAAMGGVVFARDFAVGGIAHAAQANTEAARQFMQSNLFFHYAQAASNHPIIMMLLWVVPVALQSRIINRARLRREAQSQAQSQSVSQA